MTTIISWYPGSKQKTPDDSGSDIVYQYDDKGRMISAGDHTIYYYDSADVLVAEITEQTSGEYNYVLNQYGDTEEIKNNWCGIDSLTFNDKSYLTGAQGGKKQSEFYL